MSFVFFYNNVTCSLLNTMQRKLTKKNTIKSLLRANNTRISIFIDEIRTKLKNRNHVIKNSKIIASDISFTGQWHGFNQMLEILDFLLHEYHITHTDRFIKTPQYHTFVVLRYVILGKKGPLIFHICILQCKCAAAITIDID